MVASTFGAAFDKMDREVQRSMAKQLQHRRSRYLKAMRGETVSTEAILLADTPGPGRPDNPNYHHTPFYSTKNSSLWINRLLIESHIPETSLLWFNTALADGTKLDKAVVERQISNNPSCMIVCLGENAKKWFDKNYTDEQHSVVHHPQAWKRFHSKEVYPLIGLLQQAVDL